MSSAVSLPVIELESQIHVLNRLQFLTRFSSNLIQITGPEGAGKSFLAQQYLSQWAQESYQAYLICHTQQQDTQHREILLGQLFRDAVFNEQDSLSQSVQHLLGEHSGKVLIVIDDAHMLSPSLIGELWGLVQDATRTRHLQVNVLLFSMEGRLDNYLSKVSHGQGSAPLEVELDPLRDAEVQQFVDILIAHLHLDANQRREMKAQLELTPPLPGALAALHHQEVDDMAKKSNRSISLLVSLFVALLLVGAGLIFMFLPANKNAEPSVISVIDEDGPIIVDAVTTPPGMEVELPSIETGPYEPSQGNESGDEMLTGVDGVLDDQKRLPPDVIADGMTVGRLDDRDRVVVPGDIVDSMIDEQMAGGDGSVAMSEQQDVLEAVGVVLGGETADIDLVDEVDTNMIGSEGLTIESNVGVELSEAVSDIVLPEPADTIPLEAESTETEAEQPDEAAVVTGTVVTEPVVATPPISQPRTVLGDELKQVSANRYALQLAALRSLPAAQQFVADIDMTNQATIYQTVRSGADWYIVVSGSFASIEAARRGEFTLPAKAQAVEPWVKSYRQIHLEIDRVN